MKLFRPKKKVKKKCIGVMHFTKCKETSTMASARVARYIHNWLFDFVNQKQAIALIDHKEVAEDFERYWGKLDVLFIVNSPLAFCDWREDAYTIINNAKKIIWVQNDYALTIKKAIRDVTDEIWTTVPIGSLMESGIPRKYINWNKLTWREGLMDTIIPEEMKKQIGKREGLFYHGAFRKERVNLFNEYLIHKDFDVNISAPSKVAGKFRTLATVKHIKYTTDVKQSLTIYGPLIQPYQIGGFQTALYIEDTTAHDKYCSPANRFYEYLNAEVAILFDVNSREHMWEAGYDVEEFTIYDRSEIPIRLPIWKEIAQEQKELWARDYRSELKQEFLELCKTLI